jgi:hypothetical protein
VRTGRAARATFITIDVNGSRGPIRCPVINMHTDLFGHCSNHSPVKALALAERDIEAASTDLNAEQGPFVS